MNNKPLLGQVAVVTGASGGVGKATALVLAEAGAKVCIGARRLEQLQEVVSEIKTGGGQVIAVKTDVRKREEVRNLVAQAEKEFGPVDILVNNAGVWFFTMMANLHEDEWDTMVDINCKGVLHGIGAVLGGMVSRKKGHIINISSNSGRTPDPGLAVYCGTKHFVEGVTASLRKEVNKHNVKVTSIQPGWIEAPPRPKNDPEACAITGQPTDYEILQPIDVAKAVLYAVTQPLRVAVNELLVKPTNQ